MQKGGPAMWAILVVSVVGVAVFLERLVYLHRAQIRVGEFLRGLANLVRDDRSRRRASSASRRRGRWRVWL